MCLSCFTSCAVSVCSTICCNACCKVQKLQSVGTRLSYAIMLLFSFTFALAMLGTTVQEWVNDHVAQKLWFTGAGKELVTDDLVGVLAVHRIMTASVIFHLLLLPLVIGVKNTESSRAVIQNGLWCGKLVVWAGLHAAMWFLPNELFTSLSSSVYRGGAVLFLLYQLVLIVSFVMQFYAMVYLRRGDVQEGRCCSCQTPASRWLLLATAITLSAYCWVLFVVITVVVIHADTDNDGCGEGLVAGGVGLGLCVVVSVLSVNGRVRSASNNSQAHQHGIFQSACISAYCMYLVLSALVNHPDARCRPLSTSDGDVALRMFGVLFTFISVAWFAISKDTSPLPLTQPAAGAGVSPRGGFSDLVDDEQQAVTYEYWIFHCVMALASMYLGMLLTGWDTMEGTGATDVDIHSLQLVHDERAAWMNRHACNNDRCQSLTCALRAACRQHPVC
jgi:hypothetical protein